MADISDTFDKLRLRIQLCMCVLQLVWEMGLLLGSQEASAEQLFDMHPVLPLSYIHQYRLYVKSHMYRAARAG